MNADSERDAVSIAFNATNRVSSFEHPARQTPEGAGQGFSPPRPSKGIRSFSRRMQRGSDVAEALSDPWELPASLPVGTGDYAFHSLPFREPCGGRNRLSPLRLSGQRLISRDAKGKRDGAEARPSSRRRTDQRYQCPDEVGDRCSWLPWPLCGEKLFGNGSRQQEVLSSASLETKTRRGLRLDSNGKRSLAPSCTAQMISLSTSRRFWLCCKGMSPGTTWSSCDVLI